jgi:hypothetical protein
LVGQTPPSVHTAVQYPPGYGYQPLPVVSLQMAPAPMVAQSVLVAQGSPTIFTVTQVPPLAPA